MERKEVPKKERAEPVMDEREKQKNRKKCSLEKKPYTA